MNRFWEDIIGPIIKEIQPKHIVEVGCKEGKNSINILEYCKKTGVVTTLIDPYPELDKEKLFQEYGDLYTLHEDLSLNVIYKLKKYEVILLDGDHNYYTVYHELKSIEKGYNDQNFPIIFMHDICWPYARRDLYYNPKTIPDQYRHPYEKKGMIQEQGKLLEAGGLNSHLNNAIYENNIKNGVLTAVEDFLSESEIEMEFIKYKYFNGLGLLIAKHNKKIIERAYNIKQSDKLINKLEKNRNMLEIKIADIREDSEIKRHRINELTTEAITREETLSVLETDCNEKTNIIEELEREKVQKTSIIDELERGKEQKANIIEGLERLLEIRLKEKEEFKSRIEQMEHKETIIQELNKEYKNVVANIEQLKIKLKETEFLYKEAKIAGNAYLNTVRYKIGDVFVKSCTSSRDMIRLPIRLFRLYWEGKENIKKRIKNVDNAILPKKKNDSEKIICKQAVLAKDKIIKKNKEFLKYHNIKDDEKVSIIIINRNGADHLSTLFESIKINTFYNNFEIIVVDNASSDNSIEVVNKYQNGLNIRLIRNNINRSFSEANNQAALYAEGEFLLFMNNDIEVTCGWLKELVGCYFKYDKVGAVGAKLIYPFEPVSNLNSDKSFKIQHSGIMFSEEENRIRPYNTGNGLEPFDKSANEEKIVGGVTAAVLLVNKEVFDKVGGFDEKYIYGYEDVDLNLKLTRSGYKNIYCPSALLFHHEFGTQKEDSNTKVKERRLNNQKVFKEKWEAYLKKNILQNKLDGHMIFSQHPLTIGFAVTECGVNASAGDYFTALELGEALKGLGHKIEFLPRKGPGDWYSISSDIDIVISLLESFNPKKIKGRKENLITIGWARNWFERWVESDGYNYYDIMCASSLSAIKYMESKYNKDVFLLPIATNPKRFNNCSGINPFEVSDYVFTGSYWNDHREIIDLLDPGQLPYKLSIYGKNWENVENLKKYSKGFVNYSDIPHVYYSTKLVIDDANRVTKPYGAVNSRVFDAIAAGKIVLTNGKLGSDETFKGLLPSFETKEELSKLITYYIENEKAREEKVKELKKFVFENHTYVHRANTILDIIKQKYCNKKSIVFKVPIPKWEVAHEWGDYHVALALEKCFKEYGYKTLIQILPDWDDGEDVYYRNVLVLRGLSKYKPKMYHFNMMWNISHPDKISLDEYKEYDYVFVSSKHWTEHIQNKIDIPVECMWQCTDPELFHPYNIDNKKYDLLFVGNSRKVFRRIIKDIIPTKHELSVYGSNWEMFIDKQYIKGQHIENTVLSKEYASSRILLNDHWDSMAEKGFISNRVFDAFASKTFIISDYVKGANEIFGKALPMYKNKKDLEEMIDYFMIKKEEREKYVEKGYEIVVNNHTYLDRVKQVIDIVDKN